MSWSHFTSARTSGSQATELSTIPNSRPGARVGSSQPVPELELTHWRREIHAVYREVRAQDNPEFAHARWQARRNQLFGQHPQSPLPADSPLRKTGLPCWPYNPALRWTLPLEPVTTPVGRTIDAGADGVIRLRQVGWLTFPAPYRARLALWWLEQYGGGLFLPLRDASAGESSYGGGRYLLDTAKGADLGTDGTDLVIDLNFLYHPSCRYDPQWVCPLAPPENTIDTPINAGERLTH